MGRAPLWRPIRVTRHSRPIIRVANNFSRFHLEPDVYVRNGYRPHETLAVHKARISLLSPSIRRGELLKIAVFSKSAVEFIRIRTYYLLFPHSTKRGNVYVYIYILISVRVVERVTNNSVTKLSCFIKIVD